MEKFQMEESHYVRKNRKVEYLPDTLNVTEMHRLYVEWCTEKDYTPDSYVFYRKVFHDEFNLKFQKPKKDLYNKCTTFQLRQEQKRHIR